MNVAFYYLIEKSEGCQNSFTPESILAGFRNLQAQKTRASFFYIINR